jgi:pyridoxine 4-dehydrogenase
MSEFFTIAGDMPVRRLGFGAMQITGPGAWGEPADRAEAIRVLRRAVEAGVNLIDTADCYGPFISESLVKEALHPYADDVVIATKGGYARPAADSWVLDGRPEHLRRAVDGSLRRLGLDRIDLYQLHRIDPNIPMDDQIGELASLQSEGKIRHIGLSEVSVAELEQARHSVEVATVQNLYNLTNRQSEDVLEYATAHGIGFLPWYPLATGELAGPGSPLHGVATRHNATPAQVALAWLLGKSPVVLPIPGTSKVSHLNENLGAAQLALTGEEMDALVAQAQ